MPTKANSDLDVDYYELCQRLRNAHRSSQQRALGSEIFDEAHGAICYLINEIAELKAELSNTRAERDRAYTMTADQDVRIAELEAEKERLKSILDGDMNPPNATYGLVRKRFPIMTTQTVYAAMHNTQYTD